MDIYYANDATQTVASNGFLEDRDALVEREATRVINFESLHGRLKQTWTNVLYFHSAEIDYMIYKPEKVPPHTRNCYV